MHRLLLALALTSVAATARAASDFDHLGVPNRDSNDVSLIDVPAPPRGAAGHRAPVAAQPDLTKDEDELCGGDRVGVIDVASGTFVKDIDLRQPQLVAGLNDPRDLQGAVDATAPPDGKLGFAAFGSGDGLAVLGLEKQSVVRTLTLGATPWRAYSTLDGRTMVVPNNGDPTISPIDADTLSGVARVAVAADMTGVNMDAFGTTALILSRAEHKSGSSTRRATSSSAPSTAWVASPGACT